MTEVFSLPDPLVVVPESKIKEQQPQHGELELPNPWGVQRNFDALATGVRTALADTIVQWPAVLPTTPADGTEITVRYVDGVAWKFKYNPASASTYKWETIGGAPYLQKRSPGPVDENLAAGGFVYQNMNLSPTIQVPYAGDYQIVAETRALVSMNTPGATAQLDMRATNGTLNTMNRSLGLGDAGLAVATFGLIGEIHIDDELIGAAAGSTFKLQVAGTNAGLGWFTTWEPVIKLFPRRITG